MCGMLPEHTRSRALFFLVAGVLCIVAIVPAFFLESRKPTASLARSIDNDTYTPGFNGHQRTESEASTANEQREK